MLRCPGNNWGFSALLKGTSSWYWRWRECCTFTSPTDNPCQTETQTRNLSIMNLTLPLGHDFPLDNKCIYWSSYSILACFCKSFNSCIEFHEKRDLYLNAQHHNVVLYQVSYQANLLHQRNHTYGAGHVMWMANGLLYKFPSNKSERTKSSLPGTVALNITKNIREATEYNNFQIWYKLLAPQSKQTRHNKCGHCVWTRSWMPAVWEHSRVRQLYRNTLMTDFPQEFQNDHNNL